MLEPEGVIRDCLDLVRGFQHPTLTPAVDDAIVLRPLGEKRERNLHDDGIDVYASLAVSAIIDKYVITVFVLGKLVAVPCEISVRQFALVTVVSPLGIVR